MVHSDAIGNDILELQRNFENNVSYFKACILIAFETIWNCREHFENNVSIACILTAFERFGIA